MAGNGVHFRYIQRENWSRLTCKHYDFWLCTIGLLTSIHCCTMHWAIYLLAGGYQQLSTGCPQKAGGRCLSVWFTVCFCQIVLRHLSHVTFNTNAIEAKSLLCQTLLSSSQHMFRVNFTCRRNCFRLQNILTVLLNFNGSRKITKIRTMFWQRRYSYQSEQGQC